MKQRKKKKFRGISNDLGLAGTFQYRVENLLFINANASPSFFHFF